MIHQPIARHRKEVKGMSEHDLKAAAYSYRCCRRRYRKRVALAQWLALLGCIALALGR